jgi:hypothetical protein
MLQLPFAWESCLSGLVSLLERTCEPPESGSDIYASVHMLCAVEAVCELERDSSDPARIVPAHIIPAHLIPALLAGIKEVPDIPAHLIPALMAGSKVAPV